MEDDEIAKYGGGVFNDIPSENTLSKRSPIAQTIRVGNLYHQFYTRNKSISLPTSLGKYLNHLAHCFAVFDILIFLDWVAKGFNTPVKDQGPCGLV